jgi:hypothetical protein
MIAPLLFHTRKRRAFVRAWLERIENNAWEIVICALTIAVLYLVIYGESTIQTCK